MRILVALDGNIEEDSACLQYLSDHNWPPRTEFGLVTVIDQFLGDPEFNATAQRQNLIEASQKLNRRFPRQVVGADCLSGAPRERILDMAFEWPAELIVVGARNKGKWRRLLLGSVSQSVLEHAPCPVLIVHGHATTDDLQTEAKVTGEKIVVAVDGSAMSNQAMQWLNSHAWTPAARFCFVSVVPPLTEEFANEGIEQAMADLSQHVDFENKIAGLVEGAIEKYAGAVKAYPYTIETPTGDPAEQILHVAQRENASLIVMGSHGRSGMEKLLLGSVSQAVAARSTTSVLVVKSNPFSMLSDEDAVYDVEDTELMHHVESAEVLHSVPYVH
jgi:nucleotide-binding universal stress UspA family protein